MKYTLESAQLVKSALQSQHQILFSPSLVVLSDLSQLLEQNTKVYYYGILTIGFDALSSSKSVNIISDNQIICNLDQNTKDYSLFQSIDIVDENFASLNLSTFKGQFYGYIFTPTKQRSINSSIEFDF